MQDKYNSLKKDLAKESSYQMLVDPRNRECAEKGATQYTVVNSKLVEVNGKKSDCPLFYDTDEFYNLNDPTDNDTWGGQTTTAIFTFGVGLTDEQNKKIISDKKWKDQLQHAISSLESGGGDDPSEDYIISNAFDIIIPD